MHLICCVIILGLLSGHEDACKRMEKVLRNSSVSAMVGMLDGTFISDFGLRIVTHYDRRHVESVHSTSE